MPLSGGLTPVLCILSEHVMEGPGEVASVGRPCRSAAQLLSDTGPTNSTLRKGHVMHGSRTEGRVAVCRSCQSRRLLALVDGNHFIYLSYLILSTHVHYLLVASTSFTCSPECLSS